MTAVDLTDKKVRPLRALLLLLLVNSSKIKLHFLSNKSFVNEQMGVVLEENGKCFHGEFKHEICHPCFIQEIRYIEGVTH